MTKFTIRVDTSYYGTSGEVSESVFGVGFKIIDSSNGCTDVVVSDRVGGEVSLYGSTEAEFYGIRVALERFFVEVDDVSPLVLEIMCDSDSALEALASGERPFDVCDEIFELVAGVYSVSWEMVIGLKCGMLT
jgi:hypothetical protein